MRTSLLSYLMLGTCVLALSAAASAQQAVTTAPVSVYAGPDDSYPQVAQLDTGAPVRVFGCLNDWSWCDVAYEDVRGWLYSPDLTYDYQDSYVPLYSYAPGLGIPVVQFTIGDHWDRYYHGRPWYAQRDEWEHRGPPHHRRPPGPPPSAGPPPRSARVDRPSQNSNQNSNAERSLRLGRAESSPHESHPNPEVHPATPHREERPPAREETKRQEEHPPAPQRADPPAPQRAESVRHEAPHPAEKPSDHPGDVPKR